MNEFTPVSSFAGGALIGLAASLLLAANGRIAGISGIIGGLLEGIVEGFVGGLRERPAGDTGWRAAFLAGLLSGGVLLLLFGPTRIGPPVVTSPLVLVAAGLLVGFGTRLANGCTSGHGVCGVSRLSPRSLAATAVFMAVGMLTTFVVRHLLGAVS